jgi:hypothetical protein
MVCRQKLDGSVGGIWEFWMGCVAFPHVNNSRYACNAKFKLKCGDWGGDSECAEFNQTEGR